MAAGNPSILYIYIYILKYMTLLKLAIDLIYVNEGTGLSRVI